MPNSLFVSFFSFSEVYIHFLFYFPPLFFFSVGSHTHFLTFFVLGYIHRLYTRIHTDGEMRGLLLGVDPRILPSSPLGVFLGRYVYMYVLALLNHLGGVIFYFLGITGFYFSQVILEKPYNHQIMFSNILLGCTFICLFIAISLAIYNLVKGFQLLLQR